MTKETLIYGVGINDSIEPVSVVINGKRVMCPYYIKWVGMLRRCYSSKRHEYAPSYIGCSVGGEWLVFSNFKKWMQGQDWRGKQLDKDIILEGNKIYSQDLCLFVGSAINKLLNDRKAGRGKHPLGVSFCKRRQLYHAQCNEGGNVNSIGFYDNPKDARRAYIIFKSDVILRAAKKQDDERVKGALIIRAKAMITAIGEDR